MRVWVTRAQPGADATAERLRTLGHTPLVAPLLEVRPLAGAAIDLGGVGALAFTSANGVAAFAALSPVRDLAVFTVGEATAAAARAAGFGRITAGASDVTALGRAIAAQASEIHGAVLHPGAMEPAGDLVGALIAAGVPARGVAVYDTVTALALSPQAATAEVVLIHSPKAARALAALLSADAARTLAALALSRACAEPLRDLGFARLDAAPYPNEAALLKLLGS